MTQNWKWYFTRSRTLEVEWKWNLGFTPALLHLGVGIQGMDFLFTRCSLYSWRRHSMPLSNPEKSGQVQTLVTLYTKFRYANKSTEKGEEDFIRTWPSCQSSWVHSYIWRSDNDMFQLVFQLNISILSLFLVIILIYQFIHLIPFHCSNLIVIFCNYYGKGNTFEAVTGTIPPFLYSG